MTEINTVYKLQKLLDERPDGPEKTEQWIQRVQDEFAREPYLERLRPLLRIGKDSNDDAAVRAVIRLAIDYYLGSLEYSERFDRMFPDLVRHAEDEIWKGSRFGMAVQMAYRFAVAGVIALVLAICGGAYAGLQVAGVQRAATEAQSAIASARDDAIKRAQSDEVGKMAALASTIKSISDDAAARAKQAEGNAVTAIDSAHDNAVAQINAQATNAERDVANTGGKGIESIDKATTQRAAEIDNAAAEAQAHLRDHALSTWAAAEATGTLAINAQRDEVVESLRLKGANALNAITTVKPSATVQPQQKKAPAAPSRKTLTASPRQKPSPSRRRTPRAT